MKKQTWQQRIKQTLWGRGMDADNIIINDFWLDGDIWHIIFEFTSPRHGVLEGVEITFQDEIFLDIDYHRA